MVAAGRVRKAVDRLEQAPVDRWRKDLGGCGDRFHPKTVTPRRPVMAAGLIRVAGSQYAARRSHKVETTEPKSTSRKLAADVVQDVQRLVSLEVTLARQELKELAI